MRSEDELEYAWWFRTAFTRVARTVFLIVHDRGHAEEITQDAFLQMLKHWSTVSTYDRPDAWVRRAAIRLAMRQLRRDRLRFEKEKSSSASRYDELPDPDVARAVATLAPMQRAAVVLFYWEDQPVFEIARLLQVSESTVKQHLHRARHRLAVLLSEEVSDDVH